MTGLLEPGENHGPGPVRAGSGVPAESGASMLDPDSEFDDRDDPDDQDRDDANGWHHGEG